MVKHRPIKRRHAASIRKGISEASKTLKLCVDSDFHPLVMVTVSDWGGFNGDDLAEKAYKRVFTKGLIRKRLNKET